MKALIEKIIRKRNPVFKFHAEIDTLLIVSFSLVQLKALIRGMQVLIRFRNPRFMMRGKRVEFLNLKKIHWGKFLRLGDHTYISSISKGFIKFGDNVSIGAFSRLIVSTTLDNPGSHIHIGNNVGIGEFAYLGGAGGLEIGDECIIGQYLSCHPENHITDELHFSIRFQGVTRKGIKIGKNCWIGSKVTILDGITIGNGCIIAAGAVVTKSFPDNCVIGGIPARLIKSRSLDLSTTTIKKAV